MFGHSLGPRSFDNLKRILAFDNLKRVLAYKQVFLPITFGGIKLISMATITLVTYLGNWALVVSIIFVTFMVDQGPFLLKALHESTITPSFFDNTSRRHVISYRPQFAHVFFCLNNSLGNKWFNFKIPSRSIYTIIPFPTCSPTGYPKPIVPKSYHILVQGRVFSL